MTPKKGPGSPKVFLHTLGCTKNDVDSQRFAAILIQGGAEMVDSPEEADWGFVNTCGFIVPAIEQSLRAIFDLEELKARGVLKAIGVMGCLYNRFGEELQKELPKVDFWIPCEGWQELRSLLGGGRKRAPSPNPPLLPVSLGAVSQDCGGVQQPL